MKQTIVKPIIGYVGKLNYHGQVVELSTSATSPAKARQNMIFQLSRQCNQAMPTVAAYFKNHPDSITVH